jgi:hypothetical protein
MPRRERRRKGWTLGYIQDTDGNRLFLHLAKGERDAKPISFIPVEILAERGFTPSTIEQSTIHSPRSSPSADEITQSNGRDQLDPSESQNRISPDSLLNPPPDPGWAAAPSTGNPERDNPDEKNPIAC